MLKLNTVLTGLGIILMGVCGFLLTSALNKLDATHDAVLQANVKIEAVQSRLDDHEVRIRATEQQVSALQQKAAR
jgi:hypothetical protein